MRRRLSSGNSSRWRMSRSSELREASFVKRETHDEMGTTHDMSDSGTRYASRFTFHEIRRAPCQRFAC